MPRLNLGPSYGAGAISDTLEQLALQRYREQSLSGQLLDEAERRKLDRERFETDKEARAAELRERRNVARVGEMRQSAADVLTQQQQQELQRLMGDETVPLEIRQAARAKAAGVSMPVARPRALQTQPMMYKGKPSMVQIDPENPGVVTPIEGAAPIPSREPQPPQGTWIPTTGPNGVAGRINTISGEFIPGPPTADMQNKAQARERVGKSVGAMKILGDQIITSVGPKQRLRAMERGVEAVFGTDPQFRTYQDARVALAGNLAVAQQGSRPSDVDVLRVWLPLVPDPYRDTSESSAMKWELIGNMMALPTAGLSGSASAAAPAKKKVRLVNGKFEEVKDHD